MNNAEDGATDRVEHAAGAETCAEGHRPAHTHAEGDGEQKVSRDEQTACACEHALSPGHGYPHVT